MADDYAYPIAQCDVATERHAALQSYRDKRRLWLSWIDRDEHHAIWQVLSSMVWTDVSFKVLTHFATSDESNALSNTLLGQALIDGHVATQVLAIRRLIDDGNNDIISLRRLVKDLKRNFAPFTRENFVCFDGLPYDYEAVQHKEMMERVGQGFFWGQTSGPGAWGTSRMAHEQFDKLSGVCPAKRAREDRLPTRLMTTIEAWLDDSGADELAKWSHAYLVTLAAGENQHFDLTYAPNTWGGDSSTTLHIARNDPRQPSLDISATGTAPRNLALIIGLIVLGAAVIVGGAAIYEHAKKH